MTTSKFPGDAEDWAILARRGELPASARAEFERALEASATMRVAHGVGRDSDAIRAVRAGDDELVLRASTAALAGPRARRRVRGRVFALSAATLAVAASAAGASLWITAAHLERGHAPHETGGVDAPPPKRAAPTSARSSAEPSSGAAEAATSAPEAPSRKPKAAASPATSAVASNQERTAASLFERASAARRAGELERAQSLFAELQRAFPNTSEARVSRVSLGKLLLAAGRAREADLQFRAYLATRGDLTEEALVGRAESLARLGRRGEERGVWLELLAARPSSVYAARARARVLELDVSDGDSTRAR